MSDWFRSKSEGVKRDHWYQGQGIFRYPSVIDKDKFSKDEFRRRETFDSPNGSTYKVKWRRGRTLEEHSFFKDEPKNESGSDPKKSKNKLKPIPVGTDDVQANIAMSPLMSPENFKHRHEQIVKAVKEPKLTPKQQRQIQLAEMQAEMLKTFGVKNEVPYINRYLEILAQEIVGRYEETFLKNINTPLAIEPFSIAPNSSKSQPVLDIHMYLTLEERIMEELPERNEVSIEYEHFYNKMIFDCCNEVFNSFRPLGLNGQSYPRKPGSKALKTQKVTEENIVEVLKKMETKVIDWTSYLCGYLGENDEFILDKSESFIDEYLANVREEKVDRMLREEVFEMENKWINYDEEEAEVVREISDLMFDDMLAETAELMTQLYEHEQRRDQSSNQMSQS